MTTEEAINYLKEVGYQKSAFSRRELFYEEGSYYKQAVDALEADLRAQQTPAKLDRSRWKGCHGCKEDVFVKRRQYMRPVMAPLTPERELMDKLTNLTGIVYIKIKNKFCPFCGHPLTEEAWAELERRIGGDDEKID